MGKQYDKAITLSEIVKASKRACKGVGRKTAAMTWKVERLEKAESLQYLIESGKYHPGHGIPFKIFEPKMRDILPPLFQDKIWQLNMCRNGVYDDLTRGLIYDSGACVKNRGTEFAIRRMVAALERFYRRYGDNNGVVKHLDVRKFFPSTPHSVSFDTIDRYIKDKSFIPFLYDIFDTFEDKRPPEVIAADPFGKRGTGLGSPISQLVQLAVLTELDQMMVREPGVFAYQRTMDDIMIVTRNVKEALNAENKIREYLKSKGLEMTDKGGNNKLQKGFYYLKRKFVLTDTGRVIVLPQRQKIEKEKRVLKKQKRNLDAGLITMEEIRQKYECFISGLMILNCQSKIEEIDRFYTVLFREKPVYKCKKKSKRKRKEKNKCSNT